MITKKAEKIRRSESFQDILKYSMIKTINIIFYWHRDNYQREVTISFSATLTNSDYPYIDKVKKNFLNRSEQIWEATEVMSFELPRFIQWSEIDANQESKSSNRLIVFTIYRHFHQHFYYNVQG